MTPLLLPVGTMVEVHRTRIVAEVMVVENSDPLILRRATAWERFRCWWNWRRQTAASIAAATEALAAVRKAKESQQA